MKDTTFIFEKGEFFDKINPFIREFASPIVMDLALFVRTPRNFDAFLARLNIDIENSFIPKPDSDSGPVDYASAAALYVELFNMKLFTPAVRINEYSPRVHQGYHVVIAKLEDECKYHRLTTGIGLSTLSCNLLDKSEMTIKSLGTTRESPSHIDNAMALAVNSIITDRYNPGEDLTCFHPAVRRWFYQVAQRNLTKPFFYNKEEGKIMIQAEIEGVAVEITIEVGSSPDSNVVQESESNKGDSPKIDPTI